jgi:hypothetical protein
MLHDLAALISAKGKKCTVNNIVQPAFQELNQGTPGYAFGFSGDSKKPAKLALQHPIHSFHPLFFSELQGIIRWFRRNPCVHAWRASPFTKSAFLGNASSAFKE